jgi:hypothetical protein
MRTTRWLGAAIFAVTLPLFGCVPPTRKIVLAQYDRHFELGTLNVTTTAEVAFDQAVCSGFGLRTLRLPSGEASARPAYVAFKSSGACQTTRKGNVVVFVDPRGIRDRKMTDTLAAAADSPGECIFAGILEISADSALREHLCNDTSEFILFRDEDSSEVFGQIVTTGARETNCRVETEGDSVLLKWCRTFEVD